MRKLIAIIGLGSILFAGIAQADEANQIPSCYAANRLEVQAPPIQQEVFIMVDETTVLDDRLKSALGSLTQSLIHPGVRFSVFSFSAFSQGRYLNRGAGGVLELPVPDRMRDSIGVKVLKNFDNCMTGQARFGLNLAYKAEKQAMDRATTDLKKSDVIASISEVSHLVKASTAPRKIVLIVSDMLENSSVSSFYVKNGVRHIDPDKEMANVTREKMFGDFGGADIYVMGAGIIPEGGQIVYRDPKTIGALKSFWEAYFKRSNGNIVEFGTPELLSQIH